MEPVTYFTGTFFATVAFWYYIFCRTDYEYEDMYDRSVNARKNKKYKNAGFDIYEYERLTERINNLDKWIHESECVLDSTSPSTVHHVLKRCVTKDKKDI